MRNRIRVNNFSGGMNNLISPELLKDNECQDIQNYEYDRSNMLKHRKNIDEESEYKDILINSGISSILAFCVWYPKYKPEDCISDEVLFFIGKVYWTETDGYVGMFIAYKDTNGNYVLSSIGSENFTFDFDNATPTIFKSYDRILVADWGSQIRPFEFFYNKKNEPIVKELGIKSPTGLIKLNTDKTYYYALQGDSSSIGLVEVDNDFGDVGTGIEAGSTLQYVYTAMDIYGNQSNPSAISTISFNMQRYIDSETSTGFKYFYKYIVLKGFKPPLGFDTDAQKKTLKSYLLYRRDSMFLEGSEIRDFELVAEIPIGVSSYVDTGVYGGEQVSYENDIAPICKRIIEKDKTIFISSIRQGLGLPNKFSYITPIVLNNVNDISYVIPQIKIKRFSCDNISNGTVATWEEVLSDRNKVRIYFEDMITPCKVVYSIYPAEPNIADIIVEVPYLYSNSTHRLFFCYGGEGVIDNELQSFEQGKFVGAYELIDNDKLFISRMSKFKSNYSIGIFHLNIYNRLQTAEVVEGSPQYSIPNDITSEGIQYTLLKDEIMIQKHRIDSTNNIFDTRLKNIPTNGIKTTFISGKFTGSEFTFRLRDSSGSTNLGTITLTPPTYTFSDFTIAICRSTSTDKGIIRMVDEDLTVTYADIDVSDWWSGDDSTTAGGTLVYSITSTSAPKISNFYIGGESIPLGLDDDAYLHLILNQETYFPYADIGEEGGKYCTFEDTIEEDEYEKGENILRWSYNNTFPELYFKRFSEPIISIIEAPYFLTTEYGSSIVVYTRNTFNRFILKENVTSWADRADNLIEESTQNGLYAEKSLYGDSQRLIHYSEDGIIKFDKSGIKNISKNVIDIPIKDTYQGVFCPLRNQYWLHDNEEKITYVYDIDREIFVIFTGLSLTMSDVLDKGSTLANKNIFIDGTNILEYPNNDVDYTDNSKIVTKKFFIDNRKVIRMKLEHNGETTITGKVFRKSTEIDTTIARIESGTFRGLQDGSYGDYVSFEVSDFDELFALTYETETKV